MKRNIRQRVVGSFWAAPEGSVLLGRVAPWTRISVSVYLRPKSPRPLPGSVIMSHADFSNAHGAAIADVARVQQFAHQNGLDVVAVHLGARRITLAGSTQSMEQAFHVSLRYARNLQGKFRTHIGPATVPADLAGVVIAVLGLSDRRLVKPHYRIREAEHSVQEPNLVAARQNAVARAITPIQVSNAYGFPSGAGAGESIGILEFGGGYTPTDLTAYFDAMGLKMPDVTSMSVDGGMNQPTGDPSGPDAEVMLDIEVAGAVAPKARIAMYFAPNTDQGFVDAVTTAIHDAVNTPSVISISWGAPEETWSKQTREALDQAFQDAALLGVTVLVASGDDGSTDGLSNGKLHVDFPSCSPHVVACGGTRLVLGANGVIAREIVWNDGTGGGATGGGVSRLFGRPSYQAFAGIPKDPLDGHTGRGVPDIAGNADPKSGYPVLVDGVRMVIGGTSAVAPLYAGLIARLNSLLRASGRKPIGFVNPLLYQQPMTGKGYRDVTHGNNNISAIAGKAYQAKAGWDACTGWGSLAGTTLLTVLEAK